MIRAEGPSDELASGQILGSYRIDRVVGRGGAGVVYRAIREPDGGVVALKVIRSALAHDEVALRRFQHEARAASRIRHPHLVPLLEAGESDGRPFLVSRFMSGGSLSDRLEEGGPLGVQAAIELVGQIASGLAALHAAGFVHRDVKTANVLLEPDGTAALGDLGLARGGGDTMLTAPGRAIGTPDYLAPELIRSGEASVASDVYALGCVAFAALTGAPPFAGRGPMQTAFAHLDEAPPDISLSRPEVAARLAAAVVEALAKEPRARPGSAASYAEAIRAAAG